MVRRRELLPRPLLDEPSLREFLSNHGVKLTHMGRIWKHVLAHPECPLDEVPGIPDRIRKPLREEFATLTSTLVQKSESSIDGTIKLLVRLQDGGEVEAVLIHHTGESELPDRQQADRCGQRDTLCISSQVGCRLGCTFCATGTMGLQGNLWPGEILEQLLHAQRFRPVSNIVFMGMGEPLENYEGVRSAVQGFQDHDRFGLTIGSITVSTVGIISNMRRLLDEMPKVKVAVSLHAPTQELREQIVPVAKSFRLPDLMQVVDEYAESTAGEGRRKGRIMISYVMLAGVNDTDECARELCTLLASRPVMVNLIPYNPFEGNVHGYETSSDQRVEAFKRILQQADIPAYQRKHHGRDIAAACGQLAKLSGAAPVEDIEGCAAAERAPTRAAARKTRRATPSKGSDCLWHRLSVAGVLLVAVGCTTAAVLRWQGRRR